MLESIFKDTMTNSHFKFMNIFFLRDSFWLKFLFVVFLPAIHETKNEFEIWNAPIGQSVSIDLTHILNLLTRVTQDLYFTS